MLELQYILKFPIGMIRQTGRIRYLNAGEQISGQQVQKLMNYNFILFTLKHIYGVSFSQQKEQNQNKYTKSFSHQFLDSLCF